MRGGRRKAREDALQILYQLDMNNTLNAQAGLRHFEDRFNPKGGPVDAYTQRLVVGVTQALTDIDSKLAAHSEHWRKDRMPAVDRNILRLGAFELNHCDDVPATVTINEMVELAKGFGSENSPAFINGVLDRMARALDLPGKAK